MRFLNWLRGDSLETRAQVYTLAEPTDAAFDAFGGTRTTSGERISVQGSMAIADVFSAVNIITGDVSLCPLKVWRDLDATPGNSGSGIVAAPEHRAYRMLHDSPNPYTPAHRFWATIAAHELLWGNWFIEKLRDENGLVQELRICDPSTTAVYWNEVTGAKSFLVQRQSGDEVTLGEDRVLHGFGVSLNGLIGLSTIQQCREALGITQARKVFEGEVYGQKPYLGGTLETEKSLTPKAVQNIRASWRVIYGGPKSDRHQIAVLEEGAHFNPFTAPFADMQFVEQSQLTKTEIAAMFKLPPSYLGGMTGDSLTYSTVEQNRIQKATQAVAPICNNMAKFLSGDPGLFPFPSWYCEFVLEGLMRGEPKTRTDYYAGLKAAGLNIDPEYLAQWENIPSDAIKEPEPVPAPLQGALQADSPSATDGNIPPINA